MSEFIEPVGETSQKSDIKAKPVPLLVISVLLNAFLLGYFFRYRFSETRQIKDLQKTTQTQTVNSADKTEQEAIFSEINPVEGYSLKVSFGNLGPNMIKLGVIDLKKFEDTYERSAQPLTKEQITILTRGSDQPVVITRDNSYFLLNFFWAVGLANKSKILEEGQITKPGGIKEAGNFASTGGWTLGKEPAMNYFSKSRLIALTPAQEELVSRAASNIFRPCCNNSTAFPDCNHGMALLGVLQLMASGGATEEEMYKAAKYFNAYWFPSNYYDLALFFKNSLKQSFAEADARLVVSGEYSSSAGTQKVKQWLASKGLVQEPPKTGGGCGV